MAKVNARRVGAVHEPPVLGAGRARELPPLGAIRQGGQTGPGPTDTVPAMIGARVGRLPTRRVGAIHESPLQANHESPLQLPPGAKPAALTPGETVVSREDSEGLAAMIQEWRRTGKLSKASMQSYLYPIFRHLQAVGAGHAREEKSRPRAAPTGAMIAGAGYCRGGGVKGFDWGGQVADWLGRTTGGVIGTPTNVLATRAQTAAMTPQNNYGGGAPFDQAAFNADLARFRNQTRGLGYAITAPSVVPSDAGLQQWRAGYTRATGGLTPESNPSNAPANPVLSGAEGPVQGVAQLGRPGLPAPAATGIPGVYRQGNAYSDRPIGFQAGGAVPAKNANQLGRIFPDEFYRMQANLDAQQRMADANARVAAGQAERAAASTQWETPGGIKGPGTALAPRPPVNTLPEYTGTPSPGMAGKQLISGANVPPVYEPPPPGTINVPPGGFKGPGTDLVPAGPRVTPGRPTSMGSPALEAVPKALGTFGRGAMNVLGKAALPIAAAQTAGAMTEEGVWPASAYHDLARIRRQRGDEEGARQAEALMAKSAQMDAAEKSLRTARAMGHTVTLGAAQPIGEMLGSGVDWLAERWPTFGGGAAEAAPVPAAAAAQPGAAAPQTKPSSAQVTPGQPGAAGPAMGQAGGWLRGSTAGSPVYVADKAGNVGKFVNGQMAGLPELNVLPSGAFSHAMTPERALAVANNLEPNIEFGKTVPVTAAQRLAAYNSLMGNALSGGGAGGGAAQGAYPSAPTQWELDNAAWNASVGAHRGADKARFALLAARANPELVLALANRRGYGGYGGYGGFSPHDYLNLMQGQFANQLALAKMGQEQNWKEREAGWKERELAGKPAFFTDPATGRARFGHAATGQIVDVLSDQDALDLAEKQTQPTGWFGSKEERQKQVRALADQLLAENQGQMQRIAQGTAGLPGARTNKAPREALDWLKQNPQHLSAFVQKYGYRPEGF